jgi:hypothetical protein
VLSRTAFSYDRWIAGSRCNAPPEEVMMSSAIPDVTAKKTENPTIDSKNGDAYFGQIGESIHENGNTSR